MSEILTFGTADIVVPQYDQSKVTIVDWKTHPGGELPEHSLKWQMRMYAVGALQMFPWAEGCDCFAYLPRQERQYQFSTVTRDRIPEIIKAFLKLKDRVRAAKDFRETPSFNPGLEQCNYCIGKVECPAVHREVESYTDSGDVWELTDERLGRFLEMRPVLRKFLDSSTNEAKRRISSGGMPGWEVKTNSRGNQSVKRVRGAHG